MCIFTNIAFSLKTEMFGLNDTAVRKLILDDILQVLKSQVQKYPVKVKFSRTLSDSFSCPHEGLSGMIWTPIHFRDRCGVASLRYRHRAEITVLTWPIRYDFHTRRKRFPVQCEHRLIGSQVAWVASVSVRFRSNERGTEVNDHAKNGAKMASPSPLFYFLALVSFLERSKPRIPFLGLSLLRNQTETLATQARNQGTS